MTLRAACLLCAASIARAQAPRGTEQDNAAMRYWRAFALLEERIPKGDPMEQVRDDVNSGKLPWDARRDEKLLAALRQPMRELERASRFDRCDFGHEPRYDEDLSYLAQSRRTARFNSYLLVGALAERRAAETAQLLGIGLRLARHVGEQPSLIAALVGFAIFSIHMSPIYKEVRSAHPGDDVLGAIRQELGKYPLDLFDWERAWRGEREMLISFWSGILEAPSPLEAIDHELYGGLVRPRKPRLFRGRLRQSVLWRLGLKGFTDTQMVRARLMDAFEEHLEAVDMIREALHVPFPEAKWRMDRMQSSYAGNPVMEWTMPGLDGIPRSRAKLMQRRVFLEALFLLRIEMQRLGRTPLSLDGLAIPPDPMTGRPFRYERTREGLELRASESEDDLEWEEDTLFKLRH